LVLSNQDARNNAANPSLSESSSKSESSAKAAQPSSDNEYAISEKEEDLTHKQPSYLKRDEDELSERISERNLKMLQ
jgi:hypothetical protein